MQPTNSPRIGATAYVTLDVPGQLWSVQGMFNRSRETDLEQLTRGQYVRMRCTVTGKMANILLNGCRLSP